MGSRRAAGLAVALMGLVACSAARDDSASAANADSWEPISTALGNPPNFAQMGNGSLMSVVSRAAGANVTRGMGDGRGATAGALVELYWPHYTADNLWDSYVGVRWQGQKLRWAHQLPLTGQRVVPDTGVTVSEMADATVGISIEDMVRPQHDAHLRHVTITNKGTQPLVDVDLAFYAYYTLGNFPEGDTLRFDAASGALVQSDANSHAAVATIADRAPTLGHCGHVLIPWGNEEDARMAAEGDSLHPCSGPQDAGLGGVNGTLLHRLATIAPGQSADITYAIGMGADEGAALAEARDAVAAPIATRKQEDADRWAADLARAKTPANLPAGARDVYRRAIITILQHRVDNGAFIAASTLTSPVYRLIWPRDGSKTAIDMLDTGFVPEAKAFFEFLETLLKPDGSFAINYNPDAKSAFFDFGASGDENDQPGMLPWGVDRVLQATNDTAWAAARWPAVEKVANHLVAITQGGLVAPSRDLWEARLAGAGPTRTAPRSRASKRPRASPRRPVTTALPSTSKRSSFARRSAKSSSLRMAGSGAASRTTRSTPAWRLPTWPSHRAASTSCPTTIRGSPRWAISSSNASVTRAAPFVATKATPITAVSPGRSRRRGLRFIASRSAIAQRRSSCST